MTDRPLTRDLTLPVHPDCPYLDPEAQGADAHRHPCLWCRVLALQDSIGPAVNTAAMLPHGVGDDELKSLIKWRAKE